MCNTENPHGVSSVNIKGQQSGSGQMGRYSRQQGSILIGLIVTMVIMSVLAGGMLSMTSNITFQEFMANNHARAYYAAESGARITMARIREACAQSTATARDALLAMIPGTYSITGGGSFVISALDTSAPPRVKFTSTGIINTGVLRAKRQLSYSMIPAGPTITPPGYGEINIDLSTLPGNVTTGSMEFTIVNPGGNEALEVTKDQGDGVNAEAYVFAPMAPPDPFWLNWNAAGGYSSYDLQVKIATGTLSGTALINPPTTYANGLTFRAIDHGGQKQDFLGVSLVRNGMLVPPYPAPAGSTVWVKNGSYTGGQIVYNNSSYYKCISSHTDNNNNTQPPNTTYWTLLTNDDTPMIVLWRRDSNKANGDGTWLAYKLLDQTSYLVDVSGHTIDWFTLLVRVVEAASVKLTVSSAPDINIGDTITADTGTANVFRKINDADGKVVLLFNNVEGTFTRPATIGTYSTDATWGYRSRDNYIWVFYTDPADHSFNATPLETVGANSIRFGQLRNTIRWPITDVQSWTTADDRFSLVQWNASLNTALVSDYGKTITIMGSGKEEGAIIRTDLFTRPGPYATSGAFPGEIGLVSLGGSNNAFFDDLACNIVGGFYGDGNKEGTGEVIQY